MRRDFDDLLPLVKRPSRYGGNEFNAVRKEWSFVSLRVALAFPDLYEIGMSHQGLQILYHLLNDREDLLAERVYAPDLDLEELLREEQMVLFSLESRRPLGDFDILGITLPYELCYTNILTILDLAAIPLRAADRDSDQPLVIGGGPCAFHPEPVAEFFDAILLGDGEEAVLEICDAIIAAQKEGLGRAAVLDRLRRIRGVYVPSLFRPDYDAAGRFLGVQPLVPDYPQVDKRTLADLDAVARDQPPLVPLTRIVHDRLGVEIARGCTRGCRFCQAGMIYRPVRERTPERIFDLAVKGIEEGGFEEMALLSLSTGDYSCLSDLLVKLMDTFAKEQVSVSLPSLRVGTLTPKIMDQIRRVRKTGFTLAPEAGTDRLRRVINKGITEADLLATAEAAYSLGWKLMKLYFMFGLPTETEEDLAAIPELARKVLKTSRGGNARVTVSAATFVPKPHTPFEREPQLSIDEGYVRNDFLRARLKGKSFNVKWHDPRMSFLEGVFSRGDRRLSGLLEAAWRKGARFDAWSDHFDLKVWQEAAGECGIDLDSYLRRREADEPLPWQHLRVGVSDTFFSDEYEKALREDYTPDCRVHGCQKCGLCDFKTIKPIVHKPQPESEEPEAVSEGAEEHDRWGRKKQSGSEEQPPHFYYRLNYSRLRSARLLGHLELIQVFYRAFRRAKLPLNFSKGFNPTPKVAFSPALPLGTESMCEYLVLDLFEPLGDTESFTALFNAELPEGLTVTEVALTGKDHPERMVTWYRIVCEDLPDSDAVDAALAREQVMASFVRKGKRREIDLRPLLHEAGRNEDGSFMLALISESSMAGVKPLEMLAKFFDVPDRKIRMARVLKVRTEGYKVRH